MTLSAVVPRRWKGWRRESAEFVAILIGLAVAIWAAGMFIWWALSFILVD
jgi:hypothetical protein